MMHYSKTHEWVRVQGESATVGITDHAQENLSDIVFVDLPKVGDRLKQGQNFMSVESVKAASDIYAPVGGTITEVNDELQDKPELINESPEERGWLVKIKPSDAEELKSLLNYEAYKELL